MPSSGCVDVSYDLDLSKSLPKHVVDIAIRQGEDPDKVCRHLQEFRDIIFERGDWIPHRTDDDFLVKFLRARFWKVEHAYVLLCRYMEFRKDHEYLYLGEDPLNMLHLADLDVVSVLPYRDQNGRRMLIYKVRNWKTSKFPISDVFKATLVLFELVALEPYSQVTGGTGIIDLGGLTLKHAMQFTPAVAQILIKIMVTSVPYRVNEIHIVNQSIVFDVLFRIFKPFLSERMRNNIFIHGTNLESLHKHIHKEHLPTTYGGNMSECSYTSWIQSLTNNEKIMSELNELGYKFDEEQLKQYKEINKHCAN